MWRQVCRWRMDGGYGIWMVQSVGEVGCWRVRKVKGQNDEMTKK
jgi:hypothetical protein